MNRQKKESYFLAPGYMYFAIRPEIIQTVLGSCVSICLWDSVQKWGCMNHFVYPFMKDKRKATPLYGNAATLGLIKMLDDSGSSRSDLKAHLLGGAHRENAGGPHLGDENIHVAREILRRKGIKIASEDVGGIMGRKVAFDVGTGQIAVLKVQKIRESDWH